MLLHHLHLLFPDLLPKILLQQGNIALAMPRKLSSSSSLTPLTSSHHIPSNTINHCQRKHCNVHGCLNNIHLNSTHCRSEGGFAKLSFLSSIFFHPTCHNSSTIKYYQRQYIDIYISGLVWRKTTSFWTQPIEDQREALQMTKPLKAKRKARASLKKTLLINCQFYVTF